MQSNSRLLLVLLPLLALVLVLPSRSAPYPVERVAGYLLSLQDANGALRDAPDSPYVNEDSNMNYALVAFAAAYDATGDRRYLDALKRGIEWLVSVQITRSDDPQLGVGDFYIAYSATPPYTPALPSEYQGFSMIRGVDTTAAYFVYDAYLYYVRTHDYEFIQRNGPALRNALNFILTHNRDPYDGLFVNAWQRRIGAATYDRHDVKYTADNADVYLGLVAGRALFGDSAYQDAADEVARQLGSFWLAEEGRYAKGINGLGAAGRLDPSIGIDAVWAQGYLPWVFGDLPSLSTYNQASLDWLRGKQRRDGSFECWPGDPGYALSAEVYILGSAKLGRSDETVDRAKNWLASAMYDPASGGVRDSQRDRASYSNIAGFAVLSWLSGG